MNPYFLNFMILSTCFLGLLYIPYKLIFKKTTFFSLNRLYLLTSLIFSFSFPFVDLSFLFSTGVFFTEQNVTLLYPVQEFYQTVSNTKSSIFKFNFSDIFLILYILFGLVLVIKFIFSIIRLSTLLLHNEHSTILGLQIINTKKHIPVFSFFRFVVVGPDFFNLDYIEQRQILFHEKVHADRFHTLDLLILEIFAIVFWFNPFIYLLKKEIRECHEFEADFSASTHEGRKKYALLLLKLAYKHDITLPVSNFSKIQTKRRIIMLSKNKTNLLSLSRYLLCLPFLTVALFLSFAGEVNTETHLKTNAFICPIQKGVFKITSPYGMRIHPISKKEKKHIGIDLKAEENTDILASSDGKVIKVEYDQNYGNYLVIQHMNNVLTLYSKMNKIYVKKGNIVKSGTVIGTVGNTGISTGAHLHFEIIKDRKRVNPEDYIGFN